MSDYRTRRSRRIALALGGSRHGSRVRTPLLCAIPSIVGQAPSLRIELRDSDDVAILEQAVAGEAAVLVTGDRDLLEAADVAPLRILTPRDLWEMLRTS